MGTLENQHQKDCVISTRYAKIRFRPWAPCLKSGFDLPRFFPPFTPTVFNRAQKWETIVRGLIEGQERHRARGEAFLVRHLGIVRGLLHRLPPEDRHQLRLGRAILGGNACDSLSQAMRRTLTSSGPVAPISELVAETIGGEKGGRTL